MHFQYETLQHCTPIQNKKTNWRSREEKKTIYEFRVEPQIEILQESHSATGHYSLNGLKRLAGTKSERGDSVGEDRGLLQTWEREREREPERRFALSLLLSSAFPTGSGARSSFRTPSHSDPFNFTDLQTEQRGERGTIGSCNSCIPSRSN